MEQVPTWLKSLFAAALGGFATAAHQVLTSDAPNYKAAITAGILGAAIAITGYLKASPLQKEESY